MRADNSRLTKKDNSFSTVRTIDGIRIPLTTTLSGHNPLSGSFVALDTGSTYDLYYADGIQWVKVTDGGSVAIPPLVKVLDSGNITDGNDLVMTTGDSIVGETILSLSSVDATTVNADSFSVTTTNVGVSSVDINSAGGVDINSASVDINSASVDISGGVVSIATSDTGATSIDINSAGGIDVDAGTAGIDVDSTGQINLQSTQDAVNAVRLNATAGGVDIRCVDQLNLITSSASGFADIQIQTGVGGGVNIANAELGFSAGGATPGFIRDGNSATSPVLPDNNGEATISSRTGILVMPTPVAMNTTGDFTVNNSNVEVGDLIFLTPISSTSALTVSVYNIVLGSFRVRYNNNGSASTVDAPRIQYMIIKT